MDGAHVDRLCRLLDEYGLAATGPVRKTVLVVVGDDDSAAGPELDNAKRYFAVNGPAVEFARVADVDAISESKKRTFDAVLSGVLGDHVPCDLNLFSAYAKLLACGGALIVKTESPGVTEPNTSKRLRTHGFVDVAVSATPGIVVGYTPSYEVGASDRVTLNSRAKEENGVVAAWKLDDGDPETISEDDLLEADDLKKPVPSTLRVCATTKKAKACKNCSCGLAEELEANRVEDVPKPVPDTSNAKSSCGSCYLGDAFRCASCPYLGMPAFKPGEKVQLAGNLLQDDF